MPPIHTTIHHATGAPQPHHFRREAADEGGKGTNRLGIDVSSTRDRREIDEEGGCSRPSAKAVQEALGQVGLSTATDSAVFHGQAAAPPPAADFLEVSC